MDIVILDTSFRAVCIVDTYESFIWTERYSKCGDFELYLPVNTNFLSQIQLDYYVSIDDSNRLMIIEAIEIETDVESGDHLKVSGRSLESILDRRVFWGKSIYYKNKIANKIADMISDCIINPVYAIDPAEKDQRTIDNFVYQEPSPDVANIADEPERQYTGDNLYEVICNLCVLFEIGFKVTLNEDKQFVFQLYSGTDRSDLVEFSPNYDNLINSDYYESKEPFKNVTLVLGEDVYNEDRSAVMYRKKQIDGNKSGLARRELYTDARDIQSETESGETIPTEEYDLMLQQRGNEKLAECQEAITFDGSIDYDRVFVFGEDWFLGDVVNVGNNYGISAKVRITEIIRSLDENGYEIYPTFEVL